MTATLKTDVVQDTSGSTANLTLATSGAVTVGGALTVTSGTINNTTIGASTPTEGTFTNIIGTTLKATGGQSLSLKEDSGNTVISIDTSGNVLLDPATTTGTMSVGSVATQSVVMDAKIAGEGFESGGTSSGVGLGVGKMYAGITGEIKMFAGSSEPEGWVFCDGSAYDGTASGKYNNLFDVIGDTYGNGGGGSNMFNVPDMRGRVPAGMDDMDSLQGLATNGSGSVGDGGGNAGRLTTGTLGATGGVEEVTLTANQSGVKAHGHAHNISVSSGTHTHEHPHTHNVPAKDAQMTAGSGGTFSLFGTQHGTASTGASEETTGNNTSYTNTVSGGVTNHAGESAGETHTNLQPYICVNYIIKL